MASSASRRRSARQWGKRYLILGLSGLILLYVGGLAPFLQQYLSASETKIFFTLNRLLGLNPVWDWTVLVTASDVWVYLSYGLCLALFAALAWGRRKQDYGQFYGYMAFAALFTTLTEDLADLIGDNLHRVLPWKQGVIARIMDSYGAEFLDVHPDEGIVDDSTMALFCLYLLMRLKAPRASWAILGLLGVYAVSNLVVGTQWFWVQVSSLCMAAVLTGLVLTYAQSLIQYCEKKASQVFISLMGHALLGRKFRSRLSELEEDHPLRVRIQAKARQLSVLGRQWFWQDIIKPQAVRLLNADPRHSELYLSPELKQERVKSTAKVRFLKTERGELFVIRAYRYWGGIFNRSPRFERFTESARNNLLLARLGFPVPRLYWTQEGVIRFGLKNYFFAIEEYIACRELNAAARAEVDAAMAMLARLHGHEQARWGSLYDQQPRSRTQYILEYLRGDVIHHLKKADHLYRLGLSPEEIDQVWLLFQDEAERTLSEPSIPFRLIHGDVTPRNICASPAGEVRMIDFLTVHGDLAGWEMLKGAISLTRHYPAHAPAAWQAYFAAAPPERWTEFLAQARLSFARLALRELAHRRAAVDGGASGKRPRKEATLAWIHQLFMVDERLWGRTPAETDWAGLFAILGIHQQPSAPAAEPAAGSADEARVISLSSGT